MTAKEMERQARNHYKAWKCSGSYTLEHVYKKHSVNKERAWRYCQEMRCRFNGYGLKVISHNCMIFTAGFEFTDEKTGVAMFYYISPTFDWAVEITAEMC